MCSSSFSNLQSSSSAKLEQNYHEEPLSQTNDYCLRDQEKKTRFSIADILSFKGESQRFPKPSPEQYFLPNLDHIKHVLSSNENVDEAASASPTSKCIGVEKNVNVVETNQIKTSECLESSSFYHKNEEINYQPNSDYLANDGYSYNLFSSQLVVSPTCFPGELSICSCCKHL